LSTTQLAAGHDEFLAARVVPIGEGRSTSADVLDASQLRLFSAALDSIKPGSWQSVSFLLEGDDDHAAVLRL
jgi:hypothetical protein